MVRVLTTRAPTCALERAGVAAGRGGEHGHTSHSGTVNGIAHEAEVESRLLFVHFLRGVLQHRTHRLRYHHCGACTVLLDASIELLHALRRAADGRNVLTVEGLEQNGHTPSRRGSGRSLVCNGCTPGMS